MQLICDEMDESIDYVLLVMLRVLLPDLMDQNWRQVVSCLANVPQR